MSLDSIIPIPIPIQVSGLTSPNSSHIFAYADANASDDADVNAGVDANAIVSASDVIADAVVDGD